MKKRWLAFLLACLLLLAGCKRSEVAQIGPVLDDWRASPAKPAPRAIEIETYQSADFGDALGFEVVSLPDESLLKSYKFFTIDGWYAQVEFETADKRTLVVRMANKEGHNVGNTFQEAHALNAKEVAVADIPVTTRASSDGCTLSTWTRGDIRYAMHSNKVQGAPPESDIDAMVRGLDAALLKDLDGGDVSVSG